MQDAQQPVPYLAGGLRLAVVRHQGPRQAVQCQAVHEVLRGFPEIPLEMTGEAGVVIKDSQQQRRMPPLVEHAERAMVEVRQAMVSFVTLALFAPRRRRCLFRPLRPPLALQPVRSHVACHGGIGRQRTERRVVLR